MVMHSAHNERKQETIVKILLENWRTSKKITLSLHSLHGLRSVQSAVCSLHGVRFNMTEIELIHLLLKRRFILWVAPIEKVFHVMSNAISLDNQTFLSWLVDSFINFFQLQNFHLFL